MAHNTRVRASLAAWENAAAAVTPAEMEKIDANQFASINGDAGGVWSPTSAIQIGGAGLLVSGDFTATGDVNVSGDAVFGVNPGSSFSVNASSVFFGPISVQSTLTLNGTTTFNGDTVVNGEFDFNDPVNIDDLLTVDSIEATDIEVLDDLIVRDDLSVDGDLDVDGAAVIDGLLTVGNVHVLADLEVDDDITIHSSLVVEGNTTLGTDEADSFDIYALTTFVNDVFFNNDVTLGNSSSDTITLAGTPTLSSWMAFSGAAGVPFRTQTVGDSSVIIQAGEVNLVWSDTAPTTNRTYTMDGDNTVPGSSMLFSVRAPDSTSFSLTIATPSGGTIVIQGDGGQRHIVLVVRVGSTWRRVLSVNDNP